MSRFPKVTETFVLNEILALEDEGVAVEIFPLLRERQDASHPETGRLVGRAHYEPFISPGVLAANARRLASTPGRYLSVLADVLRRTWGSTNFFLGAMAIFPKAVRFADRMEELGVEHVHAHFANHPTVAAYVVSRLAGIPFSFTAHGHDLHVERRMLCEKLERAAFAVTVSDYNRELMAGECGERAREKIRVVHCGVDPEVFSPAGRETADAGDHPFRIVCVASFEEVKGHRHLVDACARLRDRGVEFSCQLVGDGPLREETEARIREAGLEERVTLSGVLSRPEVADRLSEADAAVLTSIRTSSGKREGIPVALMEAMAAGLPVVASDLSGIPELVEHGETGLLAPPGDSRAIASCLARLARSRELRDRLGSAARKKVLHEFDLRGNARRLLSLMRAEGGIGREISGAAARAGERP